MPTNNTLYLTLKKDPFEQIRDGSKTSEYREYKDFWIKKLMNPDRSFRLYDYVYFRNGYQKDAPKMLVELKGIYLKRYWAGWLRWKKYFEIKLGAIVQSSEKEKEKSGV